MSDALHVLGVMCALFAVGFMVRTGMIAADKLWWGK